MEDWKAQNSDFDLSKFIGGPPRHITKKFYCPSCGERVWFHLYEDNDEDSFPCTMCQGIMLLEG